MSRHFEAAGYNWAVQEPAWRGHNFRRAIVAATIEKCKGVSGSTPGSDIWFHPQRGDINGINAQTPVWLSPQDLVFVKSNALLPAAMIDAYSQWQLQSRPSLALPI